MSVMLRSTNPEAVNEIDPDRDRRVPHVGQIVIYHMRPGEGRAGKMSAPAIVTAVEDDDHIEILVIFSADDFMTRWKIPRKTDQNTVNCWAFNEHDQEHYQETTALWQVVKREEPEGHLTWEDVKAMHAEIGVLRNKLSVAEGKIIALEARKKPGPKPKHESSAADPGETEGAEFASEFRDDKDPPL